jgi:hypothetical protein
LFPGYKTGEGVDPDLLAQFPLAEEAVSVLGLVVWPMVEFEADDAIASAVFRYQDEAVLDQVVIAPPTKTWLNWFQDPGWCAGTGAGTSYMTKRR